MIFSIFLVTYPSKLDSYLKMYKIKYNNGENIFKNLWLHKANKTTNFD